ncbi:MAG: VWA domain-containing protein [Candidatus Omnitrophica bacterium]|nr:VWA domain-containing protein [Candidatus Omnitrophota bacterium]MCM8826302.1 VWA domain-containing protein [Candidatus Omnitrophota bacterium]
MRRKKLLEGFADKNLIPLLVVSLDIRKRILKRILILFCFLFLVLTIMRPQWGFKWQSIKRIGLDIIFAVDVSKSMLAEDIKPNRLQRTKLALSELVKKLKGERIGIVAFAGESFLHCPLTIDYDGFLLTLNALDTNTIPKGGTSISKAILKSIESLKSRFKQSKVIVLITDGEDHEGDYIKVAELAKREGIKIFCIGVGTPEGELIPLREEGKKAFLKDKEGAVVKTRLNELVLQKIALTTDGAYIRATNNDFGLELIYREKINKLAKRELESKMFKQYDEHFQIPLALAFLFLTLECFVKERRKD